MRAGPAGLFYYAGIVFDRAVTGNPTRGALFVGRFIDLNNKENGDVTLGLDPIRFIGATKLEDTTPDSFLDKPSMAVDMPRGGATCTLSVPQGGVPRAADNPGGKRVRGVLRLQPDGAGDGVPAHFQRLRPDVGRGAAALDPRAAGQPGGRGGGRSSDGQCLRRLAAVCGRLAGDAGYQPNAINVAKVTGGGTAVASVTPVLSLPSFDPLNPTAETFFDQATTAGSFRTNAYPTIAVDGAGRVYLAWAQRQPITFGDSRIKYATSLDGVNWSVAAFVDNNPIADEAVPTANTYTRGHQIMPQMTFNGGRLTAIYYDLRLDHTLGLFNPVLGFPDPDSQGRFELETRSPCATPTSILALRRRSAVRDGSPVFTPFIVDTAFQVTPGPIYPGLTVRRHTLDVRLAQAGPGASPVFTTKRLSQYKFGTTGRRDLRHRSPTGPTVPYLQQLEFNPPNLPIFQLGEAPFFSDYLDIAGVTFVQPSPGGPWTFNTEPSKAGTQFASWTSNQDVVPPYDAARGVVDWTLYTPPRSAANTGETASSRRGKGFRPARLPSPAAATRTSTARSSLRTSCSPRRRTPSPSRRRFSAPSSSWRRTCRISTSRSGSSSRISRPEAGPPSRRG